jgi:hypothetical protein
VRIIVVPGQKIELADEPIVQPIAVHSIFASTNLLPTLKWTRRDEVQRHGLCDAPGAPAVAY